MKNINLKKQNSVLKIVLIILTVLIVYFLMVLILTPSQSPIINMMGSGGRISIPMRGLSYSSSDNAAIQSQQQEEQEGRNFLDNLNNKTVLCSKLNDTDFEEIGEYFMGQSIGDTSRHIAMNEMMKSMMGEQGEEQMHIAMGKRMSNCEPGIPMPQNMMNGSMMPMMMNMMGSGMMGGQNPTQANLAQGMGSGMMGNNAFGFGMPFLNYGYFSAWNILYALLLVGLVALVFLGVFKLWKDVNKKEARK